MTDTSLADFLADLNPTSDEIKTIFAAPGYLNKAQDSLTRMNREAAQMHESYDRAVKREHERHAAALASLEHGRRRDLVRLNEQRENRIEACFHTMLKTLRRGGIFRERYW